MNACDSSTDQNGNASSPVDETIEPQTTDTKASEPMADEMYTCSMHNEVMSDKPGTCPKCEMALVKQKMTEEQMKMMKEGTYTKP